MLKILFTVTNDLSYDQRMHRIAGTLATEGYSVLLVGRLLPDSIALRENPYSQKRLGCFFKKGFLFYTEYNLRLFLFLLFQKADILCAIDLDTILPVLFVSALKNQKRVYDAHEWFTEMKEVITRPVIHKIWSMVERFAIPRFPNGYTVNRYIADTFLEKYGVQYAVVRNLPQCYNLPVIANKAEKWIIYQGAVNEGRCFETLIPAMQWVDARLLIYGDGNLYASVSKLITDYQLEEKVLLKGKVSPDALRMITPHAYMGLTLFEAVGQNQFHSLSNRFFDYIMAGIPQVFVNYPEYASLNQINAIGVPVAHTDPVNLAKAMNNLLGDSVLYDILRTNCLLERNHLNWGHEQNILIDFYQTL